MNIKDAERLSGVSVRNIRFYEQKGLLKPARNAENDYREYCEEDIRRLQLIRALRMVDMPLEQIREVVDGRTELHQAALLQKEKLEEQIKKIKTVMKFCEELSQTDPDQVSEVLMRMDKPENRKILFKRWKFDYAEFARNNLLPLGAGTLPMAIGLIVVFPLLLAGLFAPAYIISLTLLVLGFWGYLGYRLFCPNSWKKRIILFFIFPAAALALLFADWVPADARSAYSLYFVHAEVLGNELELWPHQGHMAYIVGFVVNAACFFLGCLVRAIVEGKRGTDGKTVLGRWLSQRPYLELTLIFAVLIVLLIPPAFIIDIAPSKSFDSENSIYAYEDTCMAWTDGRSIIFETSEEFVQLARFDEWRSKYTRFGIGEEVLAIDPESVQKGAHLEFYSGNCVKVYTRGFLGGDSTKYFIVPDGVIEALTQYIKDHSITDPSAWNP